jgi:two-component system OmpR family sensor kinase
VSLRARLLAGMAVVSLVLVVTSLVVLRTTENNLIDRVDSQLASVPMGIFGTGPGFPAPRPDDARREVGNLPTPLYGARLDAGELTVLFAPSVSAAGLGAPKISVHAATQAARDGKPITVSSTNGSDRYRVVAQRGSDGSIGIVGLALRDVDATVERLRLVLVVAAVMVIVILGLVVFWVLVLGVRPIRRMTRTASDIAAGDFAQRVPSGRSGTEASELGDALNVMLETVEGALEQRAAWGGRVRR